MIPDRRKPGRPPKFTPDVCDRLVALVAKGVPFRHACAGCGVAYSSFAEYRNAHPEFEAQIEQAVSAAIEKRLAIIEKAAETGDTGCARWLLEHLHPQFFAKSRIELSGPDGGPLDSRVAVILWPHMRIPNDETTTAADCVADASPDPS